MGHFDREEWKRRSWDRFSAVVRRHKKNNRSTAAAERRWALEQIAIVDLEAVVGWCAGRGVSVDFTRRPNGVYDGNNRAIAIAANASPVRQLAYLLHECGHHLVGSGGADERFKMGYAMGGRISERNFIHKLSCLEEEFEAWHRGWRLARRLQLSIKREQFDRIRIECLRSYLHWSTRRSVQ